MFELTNDIRQALRRLSKSLGFTATAVLVLGLGIGVNAIALSLVEGILLRPLPFPNSERLVQIFQPLRNVQDFGVCYPDYEDFKTDLGSFEGLAAFFVDDLNLTEHGDPERIRAAFVTGNLFQVMGRPVTIGRPISDADESSGSAVVVLSEELWRNQFSSNPAVIGTNVTLNGKTYEIIGVSGDQTGGTNRADLYLSIRFHASFDSVRTDRAAHPCRCIGRLRSGVSIENARAELVVMSQTLKQRFPDTHSSVGIRAAPLLESVVGVYSTTIWLISGAVAGLLLISCANVGNLLITRALRRRHDTAICAALGASRFRLMRGFLLESILLSLLGAVVGLLLAYYGISVIKAVWPQDIPRIHELQIDATILLFIFGLTLLTSLLAGLLPAWFVSDANFGAIMREDGARGGTEGLQRRRVRSGFVVGQLALAFLLAFGACLLIRSLQEIQNVPLGFDPSEVFTADIYIPRAQYDDEAKCKNFFAELCDRVGRLPGVLSVSLNSNLPFKADDARGAGPFGISGEPEPDRANRPRIELYYIFPQYFRALSIPLIQGRAFTDNDELSDERVVIVDQALAATFFPNQNPIGKRIYDFGELVGGKRQTFTIVGVVPTVLHCSPDARKTKFQAYFPFGPKHPYAIGVDNFGTLVIRVEGNPGAILPSLRKVAGSIDSKVPISNPAPLEELVAKSFVMRRLTLSSIAVLAGAALILATLGLYALLSYNVNQKAREIAIRMAVGAERLDIFLLLGKYAIKLLFIGTLTGLGAALITVPFFKSALFFVNVFDWGAFAVAFGAVGIAAIFACLTPAVTAMLIQPLKALKE